MNRREKKATEKKLGLDKFKRSLSRAERFEMIRQNIIEGNKKQNSMKETVRVIQQKEQDDIINKQVSSRALDLMIKDKMDYYSATQQASKEIKSISE